MPIKTAIVMIGGARRLKPLGRACLRRQAKARPYNCVETLRFRGLRTFRARFGPCEDTCRAKLVRTRRFVRPETRQRLGAATLGSGKALTPADPHPAARLL